MALENAADTLLRDAASRGAVPGVAAGATSSDGDIYLGGFGERVLGDGAAMSPDTVGWIASMTKAITGAAAMQLVEQGRLDLDAPAAAVLSELGNVRVLTGFGRDGKPETRKPGGAITLRNLLTHTSGFVYDIWNRDIARYLQETGTPGIIECRNACLALPLAFDPGTRWDYGIGIDWAGKMVEAVSGQTLGDYFRDNIFAPLGMSDTAFLITDSMRKRLAKIHVRTEDGGLVAQPEIEIPQQPEFEMGGGGLYGTVGDYMRFIRMILNRGRSNGARILKPETVDMMSENQIDGLRVVELETAQPPFSNNAEFFPGVPKTWGLTFMINAEEAPTGRSAGSLGWAGLANSYYWIDSTKGVGGAYLTQILPFVDRDSFPLYMAFEKTVYDHLQ